MLIEKFWFLGIYKLCDIISSCSLNSFEAFKTIYSHAVKSLKRLNVNIDDINENLKVWKYWNNLHRCTLNLLKQKFNVPSEIANGCSLLTYLSNGKLDKVIEIAQSGKFVTNMQWMKSNFSVGYRNNKLELQKILLVKSL